MKYTKWLTRTAMLLALTLVVQIMGFPPYITGPLVNMMLIVSVLSINLLSGILIGSLTPWIALARGILPAPLAPMVPFIIISNIILIVGFYLFEERNRYLAIIIGGLGKYLILAGAVRFIVQVPLAIAQVMQFPQFINSLIGGLLALFFIKFLDRFLKSESN
ncbi:ECF transporter S component [Halonatronum saccharophilum]|uniref:ECF transporter S component n=1 Tax=Halonatronum saccharophilum TaxID=150060 RepID=UPI000489F7F3|nr:ECF transporter S component [Halonatronum saccharophilum]